MTTIEYECPICGEPYKAEQDVCPQLPFGNSYDAALAGEYVCPDCFEKHA